MRGRPARTVLRGRERSNAFPLPDTNLPADVNTTEVFGRYKDQPMVERRDGEFKGPLAVAPIFLRNNRRITALVTVICLALLIFCLIEREVRHNLAPDTEMHGFYINDRRA